MEGAGVVAEIGSEVNSVKKGDRVAWCISWGSYAEYAAVPASRIAKVPEGISFDVAAASIFQGSTAHYLAEDIARLGKHTACLVHAASGGIGQILVQLAKQKGAVVFATTSSPEKAAVARRKGADHVLMYENGGFADKIRALTDQRGVDVVFDAVGRDTLRDSFRATRTRGLVINYDSVTGPIHDLDPYELGEAGSLFLTRPRLADYLSDSATVQRRADAIFSAILNGALEVEINGHYTMENVELAHAALENRTQKGKAVLNIGSP